MIVILEDLVIGQRLLWEEEGNLKSLSSRKETFTFILQGKQLMSVLKKCLFLFCVERSSLTFHISISSTFDSTNLKANSMVLAVIR